MGAGTKRKQAMVGLLALGVLLFTKGTGEAIPLADAGDDRAVDQGVQVILDGTRSLDTAGYPLSSYSWQQIEGPTVGLANANTPNPSFTSPAVDVETDLRFNLTVFDYTGAPSTDEVLIIVRQIVIGNLPPVSQPGPPQIVDENTLVTLSGTAFDPEGQPVTFQWCQCDPHGPRVELSTLTEPITTFTAPNVQADVTIRFNLFVRDIHDVVDVNQAVVTIRNLPPQANAGIDQNVSEGSLVILDGSVSNPDGGAINYSWQQISGPPVTFNSSTIPNPKFAAPIVPSVTELLFRLTVSNSQNQQTQDDVIVTVQDIGLEPSLSSQVSEFIVRPNPSNPLGSGTFFQYRLDGPGDVLIMIEDLMGNRVREISIPAGQPGASPGFNVVPWDGLNGNNQAVANGGYVVQIMSTDGKGNKSKAIDKMGIVR